MIDEVNEILGKEFEIIIGTKVDDVNDVRYGERKITLVDRKGVIGPFKYDSKSDTFNAEKWFDNLSLILNSGTWRKYDRFHYDRNKLLLSLMVKVKRIRKINELLN